MLQLKLHLVIAREILASIAFGRRCNANFFTHSCDIVASGFRPLSDIPHYYLPLESRPFLSPSVVDRSKRSAKYLRLSQPLPNQLPNTTQAHQTTFLVLSKSSKQASNKVAFVSLGFGPNCLADSHGLCTRSPLFLQLF